MRIGKFAAGLVVGAALGAIVPLAAQTTVVPLSSGTYGIGNGARVVIACNEPNNQSTRMPFTDAAIPVAVPGIILNYGLPIRC
jgi:hypothetical protein